MNSQAVTGFLLFGGKGKLGEDAKDTLAGRKKNFNDSSITVHVSIICCPYFGTRGSMIYFRIEPSELTSSVNN